MLIVPSQEEYWEINASKQEKGGVGEEFLAI